MSTGWFKTFGISCPFKLRLQLEMQSSSVIHTEQEFIRTDQRQVIDCYSTRFSLWNRFVSSWPIWIFFSYWLSLRFSNQESLQLTRQLFLNEASTSEYLLPNNQIILWSDDEVWAYYAVPSIGQCRPDTVFCLPDHGPTHIGSICAIFRSLVER